MLNKWKQHKVTNKSDRKGGETNPIKHCLIKQSDESMN